MTSLQHEINQLGTELAQCSDACQGIWLDRSQGIIPRSLYLEREDAHGRGCVAVGLNPGTSSKRERASYCEAAFSYESYCKYRAQIAEIPYFARTRSVLDQLGLNGPILWSNL